MPKKDFCALRGNQSGSIIVVLLLVTLAVIAIGVWGFYFFNLYPIGSKPSESTDKSTQSDNTTLEKSAVVTGNQEGINTIQKISEKPVFKDVIIFQTPEGKVLKSSDHGKTHSVFSDKLDTLLTEKTLLSAFVAPDYKRILITLIPKFNFNSREEAIQAFKNSKSYITSIDGSSLEEIDTAGVKNKIGSEMVFNFWGWSSDGKKLILVASNPELYQSDSEHIAFDFEPDKNEINELFRVTSSAIGNFYYDNDKQILTYYENWGKGDSVKYLKNLKTNQTTKLKPASIGNNYNSYTGSGEYFVGTDKQLGKSIKIYSINDSLNPVSEASLSEEREQYGIEVYWSPNYNYFTIPIRFDQSGYGIEYKSPSLKIYSKTGNPVSEIKFTDAETSDETFSLEFQTGSIFSSDESKLLYVTKLSTSLKEYYWRIIDIKTGKIVQPKIADPALGKPIVWF